MEQHWFAAGIEPDLDALLDDDELAVLMRYDGLTRADFWRHVARARDALKRRAAAAVAAPGQGANRPYPQPASMEQATARAR